MNPLRLHRETMLSMKLGLGLAMEVRAVDAVGCGDAFIAGLLCQLVVGAEWRDQLSVARMRQNLRYANAVGALTALTQGVIPALPTAAQVEEFLSQQN